MARHFAFHSSAGAALLGILTFGTAAQAQTTTLICNLQPGYYGASQPATVELNEAQSTVVAHIPALYIRNNPGITGGEDGLGGTGAYSVGPTSAVFGTDSVTFSHTFSTGYQGAYAINRLTGIFTANSGTPSIPQFNCEAAQKKF